jgi:hypothetical protein
VREWGLEPIGDRDEPQDSHDLERLSPRLGLDKRATTERPPVISGLPKGATGATGTTSRLDGVITRLDKYIDPMDSPGENSMVNSQYNSLFINHSILYRFFFIF